MTLQSTLPATAAAAHRQALAAPLSEVASFLQELLSRRVTAYIAGVKDGKTVTRWATGEVTEIRDLETERRLRTTYEVAHLLLSGDSAPTVRAWFLGLNPQLDDAAPADVLRDGRLKEVLGAARAFMVGG